MEIQARKTYLKGIPHEGGAIAFQYPSFRGTYGSVAGKIDKEGLKRPNSPETSSLVYDAFKNPEGQYEQEILKILEKNWFWEFTGNLYLPQSSEEVSNGVIIEHNPTIANGNLAMDKSDLIKRLQGNDSNVKFVPFGYKTGEQNLGDLQKNPYVVARYGKEGAEKIVEIASKFRNNPNVWSFDFVNEEQTRTSALSYDGRFFGTTMLLVDGSYWLDDNIGRSFGVLKSEKSK